MLDVLEHIDDDAGALAALHDLLRPRGRLLITVPAYQWLWSGHDVVAHHRRRYTARQLRSRLAEAGFAVSYLSYFNTFLFPLIATKRLLSRISGWEGGSDMEAGTSPVASRVLRTVFGAERHLLRWFRLPFGVSIVVLATPQASYDT